MLLGPEPELPLLARDRTDDKRRKNKSAIVNVESDNPEIEFFRSKSFAIKDDSSVPDIDADKATPELSEHLLDKYLKASPVKTEMGSVYSSAQ